MQSNFKFRTIVSSVLPTYPAAPFATLYTRLFHLVFFVIFKLPSTIHIEFGYMFIYLSCSLDCFLCSGFLFPPPPNFQFYLDYLIHSRINSKLTEYVVKLSALDPRVYILAYDFDLYSVLILFNASLYKRMLLLFNIIVLGYNIINALI